MTLRDLAFLGLRLIAIYLALNVVYSASAVAETLIAWRGDDRVAANAGSIVYYGVISSAIYLLLAAALWFGAGRLATVVVPFESRQTNLGSPGVRGLQGIAFSAVGLFVLVSALPKLAAEIYRLYFLANAFTISPEMTFGDITRRVQIATEILLGLCLLLGGGVLAGMLARFREVGLPPVSETSNNTPHPDARDMPPSAEDRGARAGGRER